MLERIDELNAIREQEAQDGGHVYIPLNVGVGLNTGVCVVGNMGSDVRFDYSALGDSVNLASRLEGQSKEYGFPIIVGSRSEEHTSELQSHSDLVCRLLLEKKKKIKK